MKNKTILLFAVFMFVFSLNVFAQNGKITGKVLDGANGSVLPDAVVKIENLNKGTASDLDGKFTFENIANGEFSVKASYVGYVSQNINISVKPGEVINLDFVLQPEGTLTDTVTIEATRIQNNEAALLLKQQKAENIQDGISSQQIKRTPDASSSDVLKRVMGVSIVQDKFIFVRGTSERYNNTLLNGAYLPSTESDKKAFSFDIFPSNLLDNMIIFKTNSPDQPGDFTGGLVNINTIDFPDQFTFNFSLNSSYNNETTGEDFYSYNAGQKKLGFVNLSFDDGSRTLPSVIPSGSVTPNSGFTPEQIQEFGRSFKNDWSQNSSSAPLNAGFNISSGTSFNVLNNPFGVIGAFSYKNGFNNKQITKLELNEFSPTNDTISYFNGRTSEYSVSMGGILNLNYKVGVSSKFSIKNSFSMNSEDETEYLDGFYNPQVLDRQFFITKFTERNLYSVQFNGDHYLQNFAKAKINYRLNYSESNRHEPDFKRLLYQRERGTEDRYYAPIPRGSTTGNEAVGGRFFSELSDYTRGFGADIELPVDFIKSIKSSKVKFGVLGNISNRNYRARNFAPVADLNASYDLIYLGPDSIFMPENIDPSKFSYYEITGEQDKYEAKQNLYSGYLMFDIPYKKIRVVAGARLESFWQRLYSKDFLGDDVTVSQLNNDILPSVNVTYQLSDKINIRGAYSKSVSRPELRELSPVAYVDWSTFITTVGNPDSLRRSLVDNFDLRFELFPNAGEIVSLSLFYKKFEAPIEEAFLPRSGDEKLKSFYNATGGAKNYGIEIETRKNLGFITKHLKSFSFLANVTFVNSEVNLEGINATATDKTRRMQGQSPFMLNLGLFFDNYATGTGVNLLFNKIGSRISEVGLQGTQSVYEDGRDILDLTISQKLFKYLELKLAAKDILNQDVTYSQEVNGIEQVIRRYKSGSNYSLTLSVKF